MVNALVSQICVRSAARDQGTVAIRPAFRSTGPKGDQPQTVAAISGFSEYQSALPGIIWPTSVQPAIRTTVAVTAELMTL